MSVNVDGWIVEKAKVSYYVFGDISRATDVNEYVCKDAISLLITHLNMIKPTLSQTASKTDKTLNLALIYFACMLVIRSGNATQKSGNISSESIEGMSVSYGAEKQNAITSPIPKDWGEMALDMVNRYAIQNKLLARHLKIATAQYRDKIFNGIYNKYTDRY